MSEQKLCKDCKHYAGHKGHLHFCGKRPSPVHGQPVDFADIERMPKGFCKPAGRYWEPLPAVALIAELKADLKSEMKRPWWKVW